ncbi:conserved hypothetical protein [Lodderomyces elongisporus NRRL YB-4239]|uniref:Ribosome quality control complex subunit 1 n=1 Tax=Lodderomyces elongisporus (strain ATCC 11503 / CBS 2605 / JCM 1781 / NBRC 1676 / NRRL YB-4239) TaxID=379508 RepID=A5DYP6_LODEL|nr:conserved hypothetical protein [Lodderomyces elongisporus NRRL YB-4239]
MSARALKKLGGKSLEDELRALENKRLGHTKNGKKATNNADGVDEDTDEEDKDKAEQEDEEEEEEEEEQQQEKNQTNSSKSRFNAFAFLNDDDDDDDDDDNDEEEKKQGKDDKNDESIENDIEGSSTIDSINEPESNSSIQPVLQSKNSKKQKKKTKTKAKAKSKKKAKSQSPALNNEGTSRKDTEENDDDDDDEDLDAILAELSMKDRQNDSMKGTVHFASELFTFEDEFDSINEPQQFFDSNYKKFTTKKLKESLPLLSVNSVRNLDPDQEYRNLFGNSLSFDLIEDANSTSSLAISPEALEQYKKLAKMTRNWGGKDRRNIPGTSRKLLLSKIRDDWLPTHLKSVSMELLSNDEVRQIYAYKEDIISEYELETKLERERELGVQYFRFNKVHDIKNRVANTKFYAATVLTPDPESLFQLLQVSPYHHETLLQVAMVLLRQGDNKATSNALIERSLFTFDRSFHRVFHELLSSAQNGLIRLPYEFFSNRQFYLNLFRYIVSLGERSLFSTAMSYCKLLLSLSPAEDPMGVRYFMDFYAIMSDNFDYLIKFRKSPLVTCYTRWYTPGIAFSTALAYLKLEQTELAIEELRNAVKEHPYTAYKILTEICISNNVHLKDSDFDVDAETLISAETYLVRAKILWASDLEFLTINLESNLAENRQKSSGWFFGSSGSSSGSGSGSGSSPGSNSGGNGSITNTLKNFFGRVGLEGSTSTLAKNKDVPFNLVRFAILSGENKIMGKLPQKIWNRDDLHEYDVLPPQDVLYGSESLDTQSHRERPKITDSFIDYVDQNLLGAIVQERTRGDDRQLTEDEMNIMRQLLEQVNERDNELEE